MSALLRRFRGPTTALASVGLALGLAAPTAKAQGWDQDPVRFFAQGNDQCEVTFTIVNRTNAFYNIDFIIDDEDPASLVGVPGGYSGGLTGSTVKNTVKGVTKIRYVGRPGVQAQPSSPTMPPSTKYESDRDPVTTTRTRNILEQAWLPNPTSDTHTITYQVVLGPHAPHKGWDPVAQDFVTYTTDVSGCHVVPTATLDAPSIAAPGTPVDLTVTLDPAAEGTVQFFADGVAIGEPVAVTDRTATLSHVFDSVGDHAITAKFTPGNPRFTDASAGPITVTVQEPSDGTESFGSLSAGSLGSLSNDGDGSAGSSVPGSGGEADGGSTGSLVRIAGTSTAGSGE